MTEVKVFDDQIEKAIKILKRKARAGWTFREIKRRRFEKPSVKKKRKRQSAPSAGQRPRKEQTVSGIVQSPLTR